MNIHKKSTSSTTHESSLHRGLSNRHVQMLAIGGAIGTGLFMGAGKTISLAGPSVIFVYAIIGAIMFFVMRAMGEILLSNLEYKSFIDFTDDILGPVGGFFTGWTYWFSWVVTAMAEVIAVAGYTQFWFPGIPAWIPALICAFVLMALNLISVKLFGEAEFWFAIIKVIAVCALIALGLGLIFVHFQSPSGSIASVSNIWNNGGFFPKGALGFFAGFQIAIFSFNGVELLGTTASETKDPLKTIPKTINSVPLLVVSLYVFVLITIISVTPWIEISPDKSPFVNMFMLIGLPAAAGIINFVVLTAAASVANSGIFSTSRMLYGLAKEGDAPKQFGKLSKYAVPANGVYFTCFFMLGGVLIVYFIPNVMEAFTLATSLTAILIMSVWSIIAYTYIVYRKKRPELHEKSSYKMPWGIPMSWISILFFAFVAVLLLFEKDTRIALEIVPIWYVVLAIIYQIVKKNRVAKDQ